MPDLCFGFEAHQPLRLSRVFSPDSAVSMDQLADLYFDPANREILSRVAERSYIPASNILLGILDEGFRCMFSPSGILLEQLEEWEPDTYDLFSQIARHPHTELIVQPYYHSVASCFDGTWEFKDQLRKHRDFLNERFQRYPGFCMNTELAMNDDTAGVIRRTGFPGALAEGVAWLLRDRSPNNLFVCQGLPLLLRNTRLSDDITLRFADPAWDQYPLTAQKYADWLAASPDEVVTVLVNYETFGEHIGAEKGILQFLETLPGECRDRGILFRLPTEVVERYVPEDAVFIHNTISWADEEKDTSAWLGNERQRAAFSALQEAERYGINIEYWRYLQQVDLFYFMGSAYGAGGEPHVIRALQNPEEAFQTYMWILADLEERYLPAMKDATAARTLRTLPPKQAFQFSSPSGSIGYSAHNLSQFRKQLEIIPTDSLQYHLERGDFTHWIREVLTDSDLSETIGKCTERQELLVALDMRERELWDCLR